MDRRERFSDGTEPFRAAMEGHQAEMWTAMPGIVQSFAPGPMTVVVQPSIKGVVTLPDGSTRSVPLPLLVDVPVVFPTGGGFTLTFPIHPGDECLVVFGSRCMDAWWQSGGVQEPLEARMHDLSDGFAILGPFSQPRTLPAVNTANVQLRSDDGANYIEMTPEGKVRIECEDLELHCRHSWKWDVDGYGQRLTSLGGGNYHMHTWKEEAVFDPAESEPINPPEGPGSEE